jgi:hypothetical protein
MLANMDKFDRMARTRVVAAVVGLISGSVMGSYSALKGNTILNWLGGGVLLLLALFAMKLRPQYEHASRSTQAPRVSRRKHWLLLAFQFVLGATLSSASIQFFGAVVHWLLYDIPGKYLNLVGLMVLPVGYAAHHFKRWNQLLYGIVEVLVGIATAVGATARADFQTAQGLALLGAVYVVARGFNNVTEARENSSSITSIAGPDAPSAS